MFFSKKKYHTVVPVPTTGMDLYVCVHVCVRERGKGGREREGERVGWGESERGRESLALEANWY